MKIITTTTINLKQFTMQTLTKLITDLCQQCLANSFKDSTEPISAILIESYILSNRLSSALINIGYSSLLIFFRKSVPSAIYMSKGCFSYTAISRSIQQAQYPRKPLINPGLRNILTSKSLLSFHTPRDMLPYIIHPPTEDLFSILVCILIKYSVVLSLPGLSRLGKVN